MVWPAQTPKRNIQRNMQKQTTPMPTIPMMLSSNLIYFLFFFFARAIRYRPFGLSPRFLAVLTLLSLTCCPAHSIPPTANRF